MMEYFDIRTLDGKVTGEIKERSKVHEDGDLHATAHVWIVKNGADGNFELLLQKRSACKDADPGCYDISSAGHLPAGQNYLESALRELEEELGIMAEPEDLEYVGIHTGYAEAEFYGKMFKNHEISKVYIYRKPVEISKLSLQEEEVESVKWMDFEECFRHVKENDPEYCIFLDELEMLRKWLEERKWKPDISEYGIEEFRKLYQTDHE